MSSEVYNKAYFRNLARQNLRTLSESERIQASRIIQSSVLKIAEYLSCDSVFLYSPYGKEIFTSDLLDDALVSGKRVYLPVFENDEYRPGEYMPEAGALEPGKYGIFEPACQSSPRPLPDSMFVLTPGLAFDSKGHRLGKGKGYYDRMLASLTDSGTSCFCAGVVHSCNLCSFIPHDESDFNVDVVVTEKDMIRCTAT